MAAAGKVTTGFSKPYVALYAESSGTITYSSGQLLARGVDVTISPETSDDNNFYADNVVAESASGRFTGGTVSLTVDGLFETTKRLILGLPAASDDWTAYGDEMEIPYVGIGFIARSMSDGVEAWQPIVLAKCKFAVPEDTAATQEEDISWQTQALTAEIFRGDDANHNWKFVGKDYATEAAAEAALQAKLGIS